MSGGARRRMAPRLLFFFFTLVTGPKRSFILKLSDARGFEPQIRARLGTLQDGATPLLMAAMWGRVAVTRALLVAGADITARRSVSAAL